MRNKEMDMESVGQKTGIDRSDQISYNMKVLRDLCDFEIPRPFPVVRKGALVVNKKGEFFPLFSYINYNKHMTNYEFYNLF